MGSVELYNPFPREHAMHRTAVWIVLLLAPPAAAQPRFFEPPEHFYKAHGSGVGVSWKLDRTEVPEGEFLTATLTIQKAICASCPRSTTPSKSKTCPARP